MAVTATPIKILLVHNAYRQRGGEDSVVDAELSLLRSRGHEVETYFRHNDEIVSISPIAAARQTVWSSGTTHDVAELIFRFRPDIIHVHNTFPLISPSLYWAAARAQIPVVQTLHNFRLMCLNGLFLRDEQVCEDCINGLPWRGVVRKCYRGSRSASAVLVSMLTVHRTMGTYRDKVARYIALSDFARRKFIAGGLPAERIVVKPNFAESPAPTAMIREGLLFVGRLSVEKGVAILGQAAALSPQTHIRIIGEGPAAESINGVSGVTWLGSRPSEAVQREMNAAVALIVPSICYENFPRTIVEAFACALPVIASRLGALAELVRDGETGLLFEPGNSRDLAEKMAWALAHPERMAAMGRAARTQYEAEFSADENYRQLLDIYKSALQAPLFPEVTKAAQ